MQFYLCKIPKGSGIKTTRNMKHETRKPVNVGLKFFWKLWLSFLGKSLIFLGFHLNVVVAFGLCNNFFKYDT